MRGVEKRATACDFSRKACRKTRRRRGNHARDLTYGTNLAPQPRKGLRTLGRTRMSALRRNRDPRSRRTTRRRRRTVRYTRVSFQPRRPRRILSASPPKITSSCRTRRKVWWIRDETFRSATSPKRTLSSRVWSTEGHVRPHPTKGRTGESPTTPPRLERVPRTPMTPARRKYPRPSSCPIKAPKNLLIWCPFLLPAGRRD